MEKKKQKNPYRGKKVLIFGLGVYPQGSGMAAARFFLRQKAKITITDLRTKIVLREQIQGLKRYTIVWVLGRHRKKDIRDADLIMRNPGVPYAHPLLTLARKKNTPIHNDCSLFFTISPVRPIGVTGTRGKTTTTTLIAELLRVKHAKTYMGGNMKVSPLSFIEKLNEKSKVVLELSSWQLEDFDFWKAAPRIAVVTNVLPDHLNRYKNFAAYARAKKSLFLWQQPQDVVVLNYDNKETRDFGKEALSRIMWFSTKVLRTGDGVFVRKGVITIRIHGKEKTVFSTANIFLKGKHNLENALAAIAVAALEGVPVSQIRKVLTTFQGVPDRLEDIGTYSGVRCINDTTATTPDATRAALETHGDKQRLILIAGGMNKKLSYEELARIIPKYCKGVVLLPGTATNELKKHLLYTKIFYVFSIKEAVQQAFALAEKGDTILLSPAATSFNLFLNEFDRGEQFKKEARSHNL